MDILNLLRRLIFGMPKPVEEEGVEVEVEEEEHEETTRINRYNSILSDHMFRHSAGPSFELVSAIMAAEGKDGDCDLCLMFDVDECYLHRSTGLYGLELAFRDLVANADRKSDMVIHHRGLVFRAGFSTRSNRWVLFIKGDSEIDEN